MQNYSHYIPQCTHVKTIIKSVLTLLWST